MDKEQIFLMVVVAVLVVALAWSFISFFGSGGLQNNSENYNKFVSSENTNDICATPPGYTDADWKEHMGHHPDRYAQCLGK